MPPLLTLATRAQELLLCRQRMDAMSTRDRLNIVRGMIESLDSLTLAGQRHETAKIVDVLDDELAEHDGSADPSSDTIAALLQQLRCETRRLLPDISGFAACAEALLGAVERAHGGHPSHPSKLTPAMAV